MSKYIVSQLFVVIATLCIGSTYVCKNKKTIMFLCIIYGIFYGTHYLLLGATTGFMMNLVSITRNIWFYINAKRKKKNSKFVLIALIALGLVSGIMSYQDGFSIVSISASIMSTYSVWQDDVKTYRFLALPVSACFIIYGLHINSLFSIVTEILLLIIEIIGVIDLFVKGKKKLELEENV